VDYSARSIWLEIVELRKRVGCFSLLASKLELFEKSWVVIRAFCLRTKKTGCLSTNKVGYFYILANQNLINMLRRIFLNEIVIIYIIVINSALLFAMGFPALHDVRILDRVDYVFTAFFLVEMLVKIYYFGWKEYISSSWNRFDFVLVMISLPSLMELFIHLPDVSYLLVFRLLRVLRILRFLRFIPNISQMFLGIQRAARASVFVLIVLLIYNLLLAVLSSYFFHDVAPEFFADPLLSFNTIFQIFTVEGWNEIPATIVANTEGQFWTPILARIYFLLIVLTGGIFGISIVNAIFVDEMTMDNNDALESKIDDLNAKVESLMNQLNQRNS
jgi:voltage-gated sodium channel